jgi:hypothetical protein
MADEAVVSIADDKVLEPHVVDIAGADTAGRPFASALAINDRIAVAGRLPDNGLADLAAGACNEWTRIDAGV